MKFIACDEELGMPVVELTRRNLTVLLGKLADAASKATIVKQSAMIGVRAVEDEEHYFDREPGPMHMPLRDELIRFATWAFKDEFGEDREGEIVDQYLVNRGAS